jgi:hypothetical protein
MADPTEAILQQMQDQIAQLQLDLQASTATATAATAAAAVATTALAAMPPAGAPATLAPRFALSPAMANAGAFLDLSTSKGAKLFKVGAEPLSRSFDFEDPSELQVFLDLLKTKAKVQGWSRIFTVPVTDDQGVVTNHSLLQNYGVISLASVVRDALSYVNTPTKVAQDSFMLFQCIFASLGTEFLKTVTTEASHYHVVDQADVNEPPIPCGALLLKVIIMKAHVDTRATVSFIRTALSSLDNKMMTLDSDISKFNAYVKTQVIALEARGETTTDLLVNVFKGYESAQDADFIDFVKRKKDAYDEGDDITVTNLMDAAENKYKTRVLLKTWSAPTKEQEQILALTAQVNRLRLTPKKTDPLLPRRDVNKAKQDRDKKWAWKKILPKEGEPVTKVVDGKTYHLACEHHPNQWVCHTTEECSKYPANNGVPKTYDGKERLKMARIAAAAQLAEDEEAVESDEDPDGY